MSNVFFTGFEGITAAQLSRRIGVTSGANITMQTGRYAGQSARTTVDGALTASLDSSFGDTLWTGFAFKNTAYDGTSQRVFVDIRIAGHTKVAMRVKTTSTHTYELCDLFASPYAGTTFVLTQGTWYYVEIGVHVANGSAGWLKVRVDGVEVVSVSGISTSPGSPHTLDSGFVDYKGYFNTVYWDDLYINNAAGSAPHNTYYGPVRIDRVDTSADDSVQFTPLSGTNESNVDDGSAPDDDTTYNTSGTVGHIDKFTVSGYTAPSATIYGVAVRVVAKKSDSGARTFRTKTTSGSTTVNGTTTALATSYTEISTLHPTDPDTSAAFADAAAVNALKIGYEIVA